MDGKERGRDGWRERKSRLLNEWREGREPGFQIDSGGKKGGKV